MDHPLQSEAWEQFRRAMGVDTARVNGWLITFHKLPLLPYTIGYFPKGPLPSRTMIDALIDVGKKKRAIFIQLEPNATVHSALRVPHSPLLRPSHRPLFTKYTFVLDLTKTEEELLAAMHPKTRYNIKVAQKHGVVVAQDASPRAFEAYLALTKETVLRQGFYAHAEMYHRRMWDILHPAGIATLFTATYRGKILAAWIIFTWKDTIYYPYGASSREHREVMAPTLLLWEIARWGKRRGYARFDLWGALGPIPDEHDPWYGFHRFKQGFHPSLVEFVGSYDLILIPVLYRAYTVADTVRWWALTGKWKFNNRHCTRST